MTCKNINTGMIVEVKPCGKAYEAKVKDMSMGLFAKWAKLENSERNVQKAIEEAEEVFLRAVAGREMKK